MDAPPPFPAQGTLMKKPMEEIITNSTTTKASANSTEERKLVRAAEKGKALKCPCPRCSSTNTKFCYYNNYSLTQPRYLCKTCKRYWTQGGSIRSIPVGGRTRKNKRPSSSSTTAASKIKLPDLVESSNVTIYTNPNPKFIHHSQDLNLGFTPNLLQLPTMEAAAITHNTHFLNQPISASNSYTSAVELLTGIASSRGLMTPFMPMQVSYPNSAYPVGFSLDGIGSGDGERRILFPFEDLRSTTTAATTVTATAASINAANINDHHQEHRRDHDRHGDSTGYWTGNIF